MNFTNSLNKLGNIFRKIFNIILILIILSLFASMMYLSFWLQTLILAVLMMPLMIVALGAGLNFQLQVLAGGKLYSRRDLVIDGNSVIDVEKGPGYYKRKTFIDFFQCLLFVVYLVYFACNMRSEIWWAIAGIVICIFGASLYFLAGLSSIEKNKLTNNKQ